MCPLNFEIFISKCEHSRSAIHTNALKLIQIVLSVPEELEELATRAKEERGSDTFPLYQRTVVS